MFSEETYRGGREAGIKECQEWCVSLLEREIKCIPPSAALARGILERVVERVREGKP